MKRHAISLFSISGLVAATFATTACDGPDMDARFDEYTELVGDTAPVPEGICDPTVADITGRFVMALEHDVIPRNPIYFDVHITDGGNGTYNASFQALRTWTSANVPDEVTDRDPVGDEIVVEGIVPASNGSLEVTFFETVVDGAANSATGSNIQATIVLDVFPCSADRLCGAGKLDLFVPFAMSDKNAWFSAERITDDYVINTDTEISASCE